MSTSKLNVTRSRPSRSTKGATKKPAQAKRPSRAKKPVVVAAPAAAVVVVKPLPPPLPPMPVAVSRPVPVTVPVHVGNTGYTRELTMIGLSGLGSVVAVATHGFTFPVVLFCVGVLVTAGICLAY